MTKPIMTDASESRLGRIPCPLCRHFSFYNKDLLVHHLSDDCPMRSKVALEFSGKTNEIVVDDKKFDLSGDGSFIDVEPLKLPNEGVNGVMYF